MRAPLLVILDYIAAALPGWMFIGAGAAILAGTVLMPDWTRNQTLIQQRDELRRQADLIQQQRQRYAEFNEALAAHDPQLLERLAFSQLHLRPADAELFQTTPGQGDVVSVTWQDPSNQSASPLLADDPLITAPSVDAALAVPIERIRAIPPADAPPSRLTRLTTGSSRIGLMVAALIFIVGGLFFRDTPAEADAR